MPVLYLRTHSLLLLTAAVCGFADGEDTTPRIAFPDFQSHHGIRVTGSAGFAGKVLRLTPADYNKAGAAWAMQKQHVSGGFETSFQFRLSQMGGMGGGADGFAFVLQNSGPDALGGRGSAGGFAIDDPSYNESKG